MNPCVIVNFLAAVLVMVASIPLVRGRVKMNPWYGVRIPAAFVSEEKWLEINRYGGRLLLLWGVAVAATAAIGAFLPFKDWIIYNWTALGVALGGLAACVGLIYRRTRRGK